MNFFEYFNLDMHYIFLLLVNLGIAIIVFSCVKYLSGLVSNVKVRQELFEKDNFAFGISLAGLSFGVAIMMSGVMSGDAYDTLLAEGLYVFLYGILGLLLMTIARFVFDKISIPDFSISEEISNQNIAAALLDSGNVVATAIVVRAVMTWVDETSLLGLVIMLIGFIMSQVILSFASFYRIKIFNRRHNHSLQQSIREGNLAVAWRFTGFRLGVALAISASSSLAIFSPENIHISLLWWFILALIFMVCISFLSFIAERLVLWGVDLHHEVGEQRNAGVGIVQCVITISIGIFMVALTT